MNEIDIAWAAGLLEGEGSFTFKGSGRTAVRVHCQMTDRDILERLQGIFGGQIYEVAKRKNHWKDCWVWILTKEEESVRCVEMILPHMGFRRSQKIEELLNTWYDKDRERSDWIAKRKDIASDYFAGLGSMRELAKKYGTSHGSVYNVVKEAQSQSN